MTVYGLWLWLVRLADWPWRALRVIVREFATYCNEERNKDPQVKVYRANEKRRADVLGGVHRRRTKRLWDAAAKARQNAQRRGPAAGDAKGKGQGGG